MAKNNRTDDKDPAPARNAGEGTEPPQDGKVPGAEPPTEEKARRWRVFFRLFDKTIFADVGAPEAIAVETAKDTIAANLELIRYIPLEEPEGEEEG